MTPGAGPRLHATPLGTLAWVATWTALAVAFLLGSWGMALAAVGVAGVLAGTRRRLLPARPAVERAAPATATQGALVRCTVTAQAPGPGLVAVDAPAPLGFTLVREERHVERGRVTVTQHLQPIATGAAQWPPVTVTVTDPWGMAGQTAIAVVAAPLTVLPDPRWALQGRRLGLANPVQATVKARLASERGLEVERVRDFMPGDSARDIDWKATSRMQQVQVRERERHRPRPVTVVLDCCLSMRVQRTDSKLLSAVRVAHGALAAAQGAGTSSQLVAVHEGRCLRRAVAGAGDAEAALTQTLASCPPVPAGQAGHGAPSAAQVAQAVADPAGLVVLLVDAETDPDFVLDLLPLLARRGQVAVAIPATGAHHYRRGEARGPVLSALRRWRANRRRVEEAARSLRMPCWTLRPGNEDQVLASIGRLLA